MTPQRRARARQFRFENLEDRLPPSTIAAAEVTPAQQPQPITITSATVNPKTHQALITGTIVGPQPLPQPPPPPPPFLSPEPEEPELSIFVSVTEPAGRKISIFGSGSTTVPSSPGEVTNFTVTVTPSNGKFNSGQAFVSISAFLSPFGPSLSLDNQVVRLMPMKG